MMNQQSPMQEKDWMNTILIHEKHVSSEYATAVTESNCTVVRQMFTSLLSDTLRAQEEVFQFMSQQGWYGAPAKAMRTDLDKQIQTYSQSQQQLEQAVHQHRSTSAQRPGYVASQYPIPMQSPNAQPSHYAPSQH